MNEIDDILKKYAWPRSEWPEDFDFQEIERTIGFELPEDYKAFLSNYSFHETQIGEESFKLWDFERLLEWNYGYEIFAYLKMTIGIGDNGGGEMIGLEKCLDGSVRVVLTPFVDLDGSNHIEIGASFSDFLVRLDKGQKWFPDDPVS